MRGSSRPIAVFDSGVGGLPYLEAARLAMPAERFVYLADRAGFPYGVKTRERVVELAVASITSLVRATNPKALLVACNTATELAIEEIRAATPGLPVVGTVPAIKPAAIRSRVGRIGVVATEGAVAADYLTRLAELWAPGCQLIKIGDGRLVEFVERRYLSSTLEERLDAVRPSVQSMRDAGVDVIVLGCTHFLHLSAEFEMLAGAGVSIVDSRNGVAARLASIVAEYGDSERDSTPDEMYLTGDEEFGAVYEGFANRFALRVAGTIA